MNKQIILRGNKNYGSLSTCKLEAIKESKYFYSLTKLYTKKYFQSIIYKTYELTNITLTFSKPHVFLGNHEMEDFTSESSG